MQTMYAFINGELHRLDLPDPAETVLPGVQWGAFDELFTPAYWRGQAWQHELIGTYASFRLGRNLVEEVAACLLGGFGMRAEIGLAAFARLRERGLLSRIPSLSGLESALTEPFSICGASRRYRFPRQKARYLSACLKQLETFCEPLDDVEFRDRLAELPGIGPKTASWIVRNYRGSNRVAIIDVHILRAGRHIGLFPPDWGPQRHYRALEEIFLRFADALGVAAGMLDGLIWDYMRRTIIRFGDCRGYLPRPVQHDSPGEMHPMQRAALTLGPHSADTAAKRYVRQHTRRLILVRPPR